MPQNQEPQPNPTITDISLVPDENMGQAAEAVEETTPEGINPVNPPRNMRFHSISENELTTLSVLNNASVAVFSVTTGIALFFLDIIKDLVMTPDISDEAKAVIYIVSPIAVLFFILSLWLSNKLRKGRNSIVDRIRVESQSQNIDVNRL